VRAEFLERATDARGSEFKRDPIQGVERRTESISRLAVSNPMSATNYVGAAEIRVVSSL
jgi:hypothetical protein